MNETEVPVRKSNRGFASMSPERRKEVASKGGKSVKWQNRAFSKNRKLAQEAGRKGGLNSTKRTKAYKEANQQEQTQ